MGLDSGKETFSARARTTRPILPAMGDNVSDRVENLHRQAQLLRLHVLLWLGHNINPHHTLRGFVPRGDVAQELQAAAESCQQGFLLHSQLSKKKNQIDSNTDCIQVPVQGFLKRQS